MAARIRSKTNRWALIKSGWKLGQRSQDVLSYTAHLGKGDHYAPPFHPRFLARQGHLSHFRTIKPYRRLNTPCYGVQKLPFVQGAANLDFEPKIYSNQTALSSILFVNQRLSTRRISILILSCSFSPSRSSLRVRNMRMALRTAWPGFCPIAASIAPVFRPFSVNGVRS